jgi:hypothetical protein
MNDAVFEILDVDHRRLVRFLPTDHEDTWPDWRDRNLHGLRAPLEGTLGGRERHHRLRFEVEMVNPTPEICFIHVADSWKVDGGHGLLLFATLFEKVQKILLLWRSQREAHSLGGETHPTRMFCGDTLRGSELRKDPCSRKGDTCGPVLRKVRSGCANNWSFRASFPL